MAELKVSREQAEKEFLEWAEECGIDTDENGMSEDQVSVLQNAKYRFVRAMTKGVLTVDGDTLNYTTSDKCEEGFKNIVLNVKNPGSKLRKAMMGYKENQVFEREIAGFSAMTGQDIGFFRKIYTTDFNFLESIFSVFVLA